MQHPDKLQSHSGHTQTLCSPPTRPTRRMRHLLMCIRHVGRCRQHPPAAAAAAVELIGSPRTNCATKSASAGYCPPLMSPDGAHCHARSPTQTKMGQLKVFVAAKGPVAHLPTHAGSCPEVHVHSMRAWHLRFCLLSRVSPNGHFQATAQDGE